MMLIADYHELFDGPEPSQFEPVQLPLPFGSVVIQSPEGTPETDITDEPEVAEASSFSLNWMKWSLVLLLIAAGIIHYM